MMKKIIKFISFIAIFIASLSFVQITQAQISDGLVVNFVPNPLFGESNFLPGQASVANINIQNNSVSSRSVAIKAINKNDADNFGEQLHLKIQDSNQIYFDDSLANFFDQNLVNLAKLQAGDSTNYNLTVDFNSETGNDYQDKTLGFDIQLIFSSKENLDSTQIVIASSGGGTGVDYVGLNIFNELASHQTKDSAIISWFTNQSATSRVIYSRSQDAHVFQAFSSPSYGYQYSTSEDRVLVTFREIKLSELDADTLYYFRVISHRNNQAETVSPEYSFRTAMFWGETAETIQDNNQNQSMSWPQVLASNIEPLVKGIKDYFNPVQAEELSSEIAQLDQDPELLASKISTISFRKESCQYKNIWLLWFLVAMYIIGLLLNYFSKNHRHTFVLWFLFLLTSLLVTWLYCSSISNFIWLLVLFLFILNIWSYLSNINLHQHKWPTTILLSIYFIALIIIYLICVC